MKFRVSTVFSANETLKFLERNSGGRWEVEAIAELTTPNEPSLAVEAIYKPAKRRAKRGSKISTAILDQLRLGNGETSALRTALVNAGMASSSLAVGLSNLQKSGAIKRDERGVYSLVEAAE